MSDLNFFQPQRQSKVGIILIFSTTLVQFIRNFWVLGVYFFVRDFDAEVIYITILGVSLLLLLSLIYSVLSYLKFIFYIDEEKGEFILKKGVISSEVTSIPFEKIQQVNFKRNLLQRVIGVYSVLIDTAGSKGKEVEIKALSKEQADVLAETLMELSAGEKITETEAAVKEESSESEPSSAVYWEYKLSFAALLKLGLTSNYFRGLAILIGFYFTIKEQFQFNNDVAEVPDLFFLELASTGLLILTLILIGMLFTVTETFIKYYNLHLKRTPAGLQVEMGLRENTKVNLKAQRVQLFQVFTNPLQRWLDLYKVKVSLASSQDDLNKSKIQIPGMPNNIVKKISEYCFGSEPEELEEILPHRLVLFRRISRGIIPLLLGFFVLFFSAASFTWTWMAAVAGIYLLLMVSFQVLFFKSLKLGFSEGFLIKHSGVWIKRKQILEMYKLQSVSISQPLWYKRRNLVNLTFHTAAGDIGFPFLDKKKATALRDYLLYKIEVTEKGWM